MKRSVGKIFLAALLPGLVGTGQAALHSVEGGQAIWDDQSGLMWIANGHLSGVPGTMYWADAVAWADNLDYLGYDDWRLPAADPGCGYNDPCPGSELGALYAQLDAADGFAPFQNLAVNTYWTDSVAPGGFTVIGYNFFSAGSQTFVGPRVNYGVLAVRNHVIPLPAAFWLLGSGLGLLGLLRRHYR